jgi:hypothetical protein
MDTPRFVQGQDFGSIHPPSEVVAGRGPAYYQQGEHYFDNAGGYVGSIGADGKPYVAGVKKAPAAPQPPAPKVPKIEQQAAKAKAPEPPQAEGDNLNLDGWVKGTAKIPWFSVKKEIGLLYPDVDTTKAEKAKAGLKLKGIGV